MKRTNIKDVIYYDPSVIRKSRLKGWRYFFWDLFGNRSYARNTNSKGVIFVISLALVPILLLLKISQIDWLPIPIIWEYMAIISINIALMIFTITFANESWLFGLIPILIGITGLFDETRYSLTVFKFDIAPFIYMAYVLAGVISILRRRINGFIWFILDRMIIRYFKEHSLDPSENSYPINNYSNAFDRLHDTVENLLDLNQQLNLSKVDRDQITKWLSSHTQYGLEQAISKITGEIKHV